jgi:hypothetical protein
MTVSNASKDRQSRFVADCATEGADGIEVHVRVSDKASEHLSRVSER